MPADPELVAAMKQLLVELRPEERSQPWSIMGLSGKTFTLEELVKEVEADSDVGRAVMRTIHFVEIKRLMGRKR